MKSILYFLAISTLPMVSLFSSPTLKDTNKICPIHHITLLAKIVYNPAPHSNVDPSEEWGDFDNKYNTDIKFPYAIPWYSSLTRCGVNTQKTTILYCPECQKEMNAAWKKFDKKWQKQHPN